MLGVPTRPFYSQYCKIDPETLKFDCRFIFSTNNFCQFYEPHQYLEAVPKTRKQMPKPRPAQAPKEDLMSTIQAGIPLKNLNLRGLDTDTKLILAEKEQSLLGLGWLLKCSRFLTLRVSSFVFFVNQMLASHETIKILQMKVHRLEQLLSLKDRRIEELKKQLEMWPLCLIFYFCTIKSIFWKELIFGFFRWKSKI